MSDYTAYILAQVYAEVALIEGMKIENQIRLQSGQQPAYGEKEFQAIASTLSYYAGCINENR